jgi:hypothetical protein
MSTLPTMPRHPTKPTSNMNCPPYFLIYPVEIAAAREVAAKGLKFEQQIVNGIDY